MNTITIKTDFIKLHQLLKLSGVISQGSDAKIIILDGQVKVNGNVCYQRGKKIFLNDIIQVFDHTFKVVGE